MIASSSQKIPCPYQKIQPTMSSSFKNFATFTTPVSTDVSRTFFAYHFAEASISHCFSPSVPLSWSVQTSLSISAKKCNSLNLSRIGCFGPKDRRSFTKVGKLMLSSILIESKLCSFKGLSWRTHSFFNFASTFVYFLV